MSDQVTSCKHCRKEIRPADDLFVMVKGRTFCNDDHAIAFLSDRLEKLEELAEAVGQALYPRPAVAR